MQIRGTGQQGVTVRSKQVRGITGVLWHALNVADVHLVARQQRNYLIKAQAYTIYWF